MHIININRILILSVAILVLNSSCSRSYHESNIQYAEFLKRLYIGMNIAEAKVIAENKFDLKLGYFAMHYDSLVETCAKVNSCSPADLSNLVVYQELEDEKVVITHAVGVFRHKKLFVAEYFGVFYEEESGKIIGWVHHY